MESTGPALELGLTKAVLLGAVSATPASDACPARRYCNEPAATPFLLVFQVPTELIPSPIKNREFGKTQFGIAPYPAFRLSRQRPIKNKPTAAGNAAHLAPLIAVGPELDFVGLISSLSAILGATK